MNAWPFLQNVVLGLAGHPLLLLLLATTPCMLLAWRKQVFPNLALVVLIAIPALVSCILLFRPDAIGGVLLIDLLIVVAASYDVFSLPRTRDFAIERHCQLTASLRKKHLVELILSNLSDQPRELELRDDLPQEFTATPDLFALSLPPKRRSTVKYEVLASRRGAFQLKVVYLRVRSRLWLWTRILCLPCSSAINVYPDMKQLSEFELLARTNRLSLMGVRRTRRVGQDNDFERLRDYSIDDNYKHIDWRSTARRRKLTVRDFQTNQSQRLIFMIDCGRMMTGRAAGLSLLDHAFNSMLMLSYVALQRGDSVGLICFSDRIHAFVPPRGGGRQMNRLLRASFDRFPDLVESRYSDAFLHLSKFCRKRSLVVLVSNVIDEINANQIHQHLTTISHRHLALGVLLRDHRMFDAADQASNERGDLFRAAAAAEIICWRHDVLTDLRHQGVLALDLFPEDMTAPLINQYLEIKARHLL